MGTATTLEALKQRRRELVENGRLGESAPARPPRVFNPQASAAVPQWLRLLSVACTFGGPFSAEQLAVAAWKAHPAVFSMHGYAHPDLHRVVWLLSGRRGLVHKGRLRKLGGGFYEVTERGRACCSD